MEQSVKTACKVEATYLPRYVVGNDAKDFTGCGGMHPQLNMRQLQ